MPSTFAQSPTALLLTIVACLLSCSGCDQSNASKRKSADRFKGESVAQIRAAYGVTNCHVGMPIAELDEGWQRKHDGYLFNEQIGIGVSFEDDVVIDVKFIYLGKDSNPCGLLTEKGISAESKRNDVIDTYGEPSYVSKTTVSEFGEFPGATDVGVNYVEDGIDFTFIDGKLESIGVYNPIEDFDYESLRDPRDSGVIFVRASGSKRDGPSQK
jgi:hypothetical protein